MENDYFYLPQDGSDLRVFLESALGDNFMDCEEIQIEITFDPPKTLTIDLKNPGYDHVRYEMEVKRCELRGE